MNLEEFKEKILDSKVKKNTLRPHQKEKWDKVNEDQKPYGNGYKPKNERTLSGYKEVCPNCGGMLIKEELGKHWETMFGEYWYYFIQSCFKCGYKYADLKSSQS